MEISFDVTKNLLPEHRHVDLIVDRIAQHMTVRDGSRLIQPQEQGVARAQAASDIIFF